jgi:hypothetical protein
MDYMHETETNTASQINETLRREYESSLSMNKARVRFSHVMAKHLL